MAAHPAWTSAMTVILGDFREDLGRTSVGVAFLLSRGSDYHHSRGIGEVEE